MENKWIETRFEGSVADDFQGKTTWRSPSNIALVKYWGKRGVQLPCNPSISFTLSHCYTETSITYRCTEQFEFKFSFEGKENPAFGNKIEHFILDNIDYFPFLNQLRLNVDSRNSFPHSSGIASSASSMSALVMCLLDIERQCSGNENIDLEKASFFSRLASGSASRSIFPECALWGQTPSVNGSSDEYAMPLNQELHPVFKNYRDSILIVSSAAKSTSSSVGHSLMNEHPKAAQRYQTARENTEKLLVALKQGDLNTFIKITEAEALQLHDLMATSNPPVMLAKPATLQIIKSVIDYRVKSHVPICFTLDAGPNVHLLYPEEVADVVRDYIDNFLANFCVNGIWIEDKMGQGPQKI